MVEALTQHGMPPTSTPNIYKVIDNLHMLWMGVWIRHHAVTTKLVGPDLGSQLNCVTCVPTNDAMAMAPTSIPNI